MAVRDGHRTFRTEQRAAIILNALRAGNTREAAAAYAGMSHDTLTRWRRADASFRRAVDEAEATAEVRMATVVADAAFGRPAQYDDMGRLIRAEVRPDPHHAEWWLERRRPHAWGRRVSVDIRAVVERYAEEVGIDAADLGAAAAALLAEHAATARR
jgi:transposase-like protein